jgi:hypothetical protein
MMLALQLTIFFGALALLIGLFFSAVGATDRRKRKLLAWQESRRVARQPWDMDRDNRRGNR